MLQDHSDDVHLSVLMGGSPSGRSQTLLLAAWLRSQISVCNQPIQHGLDSQLSLRLLAESGPDPTGRPQPVAGVTKSTASASAAITADHPGSGISHDSHLSAAAVPTSMPTARIVSPGKGVPAAPSKCKGLHAPPLAADQPLPKQTSFSQETAFGAAESRQTRGTTRNPPQSKPTRGLPAESPRRLALPISNSQFQTVSPRGHP